MVVEEPIPEDLQVNAINTHNADIEIYMKIYWRFNDLAGAIGRDQIEFYSPEGGGDGTDPELLTGEMLDTGIPNGTLVRGGLPRRKHGKRGDGKGLAVDPIETSHLWFHPPLSQARRPVPSWAHACAPLRGPGGQGGLGTLHLQPQPALG